MEDLVGGAGEDLGTIVHLVVCTGHGLVVEGVAGSGASPPERSNKLAKAGEGVRPVQVPIDLLEQGAGASWILQRGPHLHLVGERFAPGVESQVQLVDV